MFMAATQHICGLLEVNKLDMNLRSIAPQADHERRKDDANSSTGSGDRSTGSGTLFFVNYVQ